MFLALPNKQKRIQRAHGVMSLCIIRLLDSQRGNCNNSNPFLNGNHLFISISILQLYDKDLQNLHRLALLRTLIYPSLTHEHPYLRGVHGPAVSVSGRASLGIHNCSPCFTTLKSHFAKDCSYLHKPVK